MNLKHVAHCVVVSAIAALSLASTSFAAVFVEDYTTGTPGDPVPDYVNAVASDRFEYGNIGGSTFGVSDNNGLNVHYKNFTTEMVDEFGSGLTSFTLDTTVRVASGEMQFGLASQTSLNGGSYSSNQPLIGFSVRNTELNLIRPNAAGTSLQLTSSLQDPANNTRINIRLVVDTITETVDVFYKTNSASTFNEVGSDIDLQWDFADVSDIGRWWVRSRTGSGMESATITTVPEPSTALALGIGGIALGLLRRKRS